MLAAASAGAFLLLALSSGSADLQGADLQGADLQGADLQGVGSQAAGRHGVQVRVGLATDRDRVDLREATTLEVVVEGAAVDSSVRVSVRPQGSVARPWVYRLQVGAVREPNRADALAREMGRATGLPWDLAFDADTGLTKVRVGRWTRRSDAEAAKARQQAAGREAWVVEEPGELGDIELQVSASRTRRSAGPVRIRRRDGGPIRWAGTTYRGSIEVGINRRGKLNVILVTDLESYLRGVIPREMGPRIYDDLETLKAQAIAARSYALHNMGEFEAEGFDICATPRCQVFGGVSAEHPLSDRAVRETAGLVLVDEDGEIADTLYTATCGGHTEDVETVFPLKSHRYLRGVPCIEGGSTSVARHSGWEIIESRAVRALIGDLGSNPAEVGQSFQRMVERAGYAAAADQLRGFDRPEVIRFLRSALDLVADPTMFGDKEAFVSSDPLAQAWGDLVRGRGRVRLADLRRLLYLVAVRVGEIEETDARFLRRQPESSKVLAAGSAVFEIEPGIPWHFLGGVARPLSPGDPLEVLRVGEGVGAVVVPTSKARIRNAPGTKVWREFRSDADLARRTAAEFPGFRLRSLHIGERGVSGRVKSLELLGSQGQVRRLEGLSIRWFLDLQETWFTASRGRDRDAGSGWIFSGRGWGHGVGMCQRGAYRMGLRGLTFRDILGHYYTDLDIQPVS